MSNSNKKSNPPIVRIGDLVATTRSSLGLPEGSIGMVVEMGDNLVCRIEFFGDVAGRKTRRVNRFNLKIVQRA